MKKIIIALFIIMLVTLGVFIGVFANSHMQKATPVNNNTTPHNNNSSVAVAKGTNNEQSTDNSESSSVEQSDTNKQNTKQAENKQPKQSLSSQQDNSYQEESYVETTNDFDDSKYLSTDDYYVSDAGFVISKDHDNHYWYL